LSQLFVRSTTQRRGFLPRIGPVNAGSPRRHLCGLTPRARFLLGLLVVVSLVQAEVLRTPRASGTLEHDGIERLATHVFAVNIALARRRAARRDAERMIGCTLREDLIVEVSKLAREGRFDYLLVESTGLSEPLPGAEPRLGRRTVLTVPLLPPPLKN
jgi:hypothetical protein